MDSRGAGGVGPPHTVILDASVAIKWCLADESDPAANALLDGHRQGQIEMAVPDLFLPEMASALVRAVRRGRLDAKELDDAFTLLQGLDLEILGTDALVPTVCREALATGCTTYDLFYVLLAQARNDVLVTADERLVRALAHRFPVRSLASFSEW